MFIVVAIMIKTLGVRDGGEFKKNNYRLRWHRDLNKSAEHGRPRGEIRLRVIAGSRPLPVIVISLRD